MIDQGLMGPWVRRFLLEYLVSPPVQTLLHETWGRPYEPFARRPAGWLKEQLAHCTIPGSARGV